MKYIIIILFLLSSAACRKQSPLEEALNNAGDNRSELEKVLEHYTQSPKDSSKLKAAEFLIENMFWHYNYEGVNLNKFYSSIDKLFLSNTSDAELKKKLDSIYQELFFNVGLSISEDLKKIKADYLIQNIDDAFEVYEYSWHNKKTSFDVFCENILPYRLSKEPLENWREEYKNHFSGIMDSLINAGTTDSAICSAITDLQEIIYYVPKSVKFDLPPSSLINLRMGDCIDYTSLGAYIARSYGIPVTCDFIVQWGNAPYKHEWNSLLLDNKRFIPFQIGEYCQFGDFVKNLGHNIPPKIFRKTYSIQKESLFIQAADKEEIPPIFRSPYFKDVSDLYFNAVDISITPDHEDILKKKYAYIMCFNVQDWAPVYWSKKEHGSYTFRKMAKNVMYTVMSYKEGKFSPLSYPFYINEEGKMVKLKPDKESRKSVDLKRKFFTYLSDDYSKRMNGGVFQAANKPDFSDAINLYKIDYNPDLVPNRISINNNNQFKYFRYLSPNLSHGNIAELEIYNNSGEKVKGRLIGTQGSYKNNGYDISKVIDGNILSYFDSPQSDGSWVGFCFDQKTQIGKIIFTPRNDDNSIVEGQIYELFYWNNGWESLGKKCGDTTYVLKYDNVPDNALLLLKNHSKGKEERIFTYENGQQRWW